LETGGEAKQKIESGTESEINIQQKETHQFPVIGIGASAGGLEAFSKFFENMPANSGMAFVLIQHLDPTHTSSMVELLKRYTPMPVYAAEDGMKLQPNHVYMIPPNRNMTITNRTLKLVEQTEHPGIPHSIDLFFRSLAEDLKEKAICIILSGTGSDGSIGAKAVKAEMGMVMVQDPDTARYDGMPLAAIAAGVADFVLPVEQMPKRLMDYIEQYYGKRPLQSQATPEDLPSLSQILSLIRARTKRDFSGYKLSTISRRIKRRMGLNQIENINDYLKFLREHPAEVDALIKDFLINVTSFFRDPEAFDILKEELKEILQEKEEGSEIRAWVAGCSTGEEAYTIAMVIEEAMDELKKYLRIQVFGTDLDGDAIATARAGSYPSSIVADVGEERIRKYFVRNDDQYQVKRDLRERLIFAVHDITADPPFTRMDLVSARNLLIYFDANLQKRLIPMFHYALNERGLLLLGTAETVGDFDTLFIPVDRKWKLYRVDKKSKQTAYSLPENILWRETVFHGGDDQFKPGSDAGARIPERILLEALPPSLLVDKNYQVVFTHGDTRKYLGLPQGKPRTDVLAMVRSELRSYLASGLHEALSTGKEVVRDGCRIKNNGDNQIVKIIFKPVLGGENLEKPAHVIVTFQDMPRIKKSRIRNNQVDPEKLKELEQELQFTKDTLRGTIEELETANEELRSANEEYQSTNEELQSTNEELETSREELQSLNEELTTLNTEYQRKIEELTTINDDMKNLLNTTGVATIFLDANLKLQRFTPGATRIFNFIEADVGRPLSDITSRLEIENLADLGRQVLDTLVPVKRNVMTRDGKWYSMRIHPYRTTENAIAGIGISFIEFGEEDIFRIGKDFAQMMSDIIPVPLLILDAEFKVVFANKAFYSIFKLNPADVKNKGIYGMAEKSWDIPELRRLLEEVIPENSLVEGFEIEHQFHGLGLRRIIINARRIYDEKGSTQHIIMVITNIIKKKQA